MLKQYPSNFMTDTRLHSVNANCSLNVVKVIMLLVNATYTYQERGRNEKTSRISPLIVGKQVIINTFAVTPLYKSA